MQKPSQYFEGILQLRSPTNEIVAFVKEQVVNNGNVHIAKEKKWKNGVDMYFSSQHFMQGLGKKLKDKFHGVLIVSRRLHTQSHLTSKMVYRVSVFFRPLTVLKGDLVKISDESWKVLLISNQAQVQNLVSGEKKWLKLDVLEQLQKVETVLRV